MLNPFPDLLTYGFFAPTLLRIAAGLTLIYVAYAYWQQRDAIAQEDFPIVGAQPWTAPLAAIAFTIIGLALVLGYYTQIAALLGAVGAGKLYLFSPAYRSLAVLSRGTVILLFVICMSLLLSGAGALAYDLPL